MESKRDQVHFFNYLQEVRNFFLENSFVDCLTPPAVTNPGMEVHLHPFELYSVKDKKNQNIYLHTSPEFYMKELLTTNLKNIFTINYCFRDEPKSENHRMQFLMLEWYRKNSFYTDLMDDCEKLISRILKKDIIIERKTVDDIFEEILGFKISHYLESSKLREYIIENFREITLDKQESYSWDDYFFLIFLNYIEPKLSQYPFLILYKYPKHLSALSTINKDNPDVCDRFELYVNGVEIANAFNELENMDEQKLRFKKQHEEKKNLYNYELGEANILYDSLDKGIGNPSGIALGIERLYRELYNKHPFWD